MDRVCTRNCYRLQQSNCIFTSVCDRSNREQSKDYIFTATLYKKSIMTLSFGNTTTKTTTFKRNSSPDILIMMSIFICSLLNLRILSVMARQHRNLVLLPLRKVSRPCQVNSILMQKSGESRITNHNGVISMYVGGRRPMYIVDETHMITSYSSLPTTPLHIML